MDAPEPGVEETLPEEATEDGEEEAGEEEVIYNEWPALPEWTAADLQKVRDGELVPGESLLREIDGELSLPPAPEPATPEEALPPEPPAEPEVIDPTLVEERFREAYFGRRPVSYLMDPQEMLSRQEFRDRESFLNYHAEDSRVKLYVYLFDAEQQLPDGRSLQQTFDEHLKGTGPAALVFYFLGRPERSEMVLSADIRSVVTREERERALRTAIREAFEKSDPVHQLDNFSVELSIRLYWFEKAMAAPSLDRAAEDELVAEPPGPLPITLPPAESRVLEYLNRSLWIILVLVLSVVLGWMGRFIARRRVNHVFPEVEVEPLLGAPHAAGVGAVISFSSSQLPPAQQRDHVPDYLQKI